MTLLGGLLTGVDNTMLWLGSRVKKNIADYCDLETAESDEVLVAKDGSLMSIIKIEGCKSLIGGKSFYSNLVLPLEGALNQSLSGRTHAMQFYFVQDPDRTEDEIRKFLGSARETMNRLNLDMNDMLEERVKNLSKWTTFEAAYLVLWTKPAELTKADKKYETKKKSDLFGEVNIPLDRGQNPFQSTSVLYDRHKSFVDSFISDLARCGVASSLLKSDQAAKEIRSSIDMDWTSKEWKPILPGDKTYPQLRKGYINKEEWDVSLPKLSEQLSPRDAKIVSDSMVKIGNKLYCPVYINLFGKDPSLFGELFSRLMNRHLPWKASFTIEGDGLAAFTMKKSLVAFLSFAAADNKLISTAFEKLSFLKADQAKTMVKIRASFCTWGPANNPDEVSRRASDLARAVEGWGSCEVSELAGDPEAGVVSSSLGFTLNNIGTGAAAPIDEVLKMMPLSRPSSPWEYGAVTFRSPDGKLLPYQPGSHLQTTWINLIFAKPGSGKSVLLNMTNLALCLAPGIKRLPRIAIIDIGPSSSGLISLIQEALPPGKKHLAAYHRLKMTREYSINPFDTQLGARFPSAVERQFLINFVTLLVTDPNKEAPYSGMSALVTVVVDEMYKRTSDKGSPNPYGPGQEVYVDEAIEKYGIHTDKHTTWWEVVDELFKKGCIHEATLAQRRAVPVLSEAALAAKDEKIRSQYQDVELETKESLVNGFSRMITEALSTYPILVRPTAFDIGEARVVSLDLDEVAKTGGVIADRQTAVMYMLARYLLAKDFYVTEDSLNELPYPAHLECPPTVPKDEYRKHHLVRVEELREDLKRICYDEFHRTSKAQAVRDQVLVDMREGRKWAVDVTLASQTLEDFDSTMMEFATGIFIMDGGNAQSVKKVGEVFSCSDPAELNALQYSVTGPKKGGGTFLAKFSTKQGWYTMLLTSTLGPIELWAFSTTASDVTIRKKLYKKVGPKMARKLLAKKYPGGSAKEDVDGRREKLKNQGVSVDGDGSDIEEAIINELMDLKKYHETNGIPL